MRLKEKEEAEEEETSQSTSDKKHDTTKETPATKGKEKEEEADDDDQIFFDSSLFVNEEYLPQTFTFGSVEQRVFCLKSASTDFDLTGQVIWPASDILSKYIISHQSEFSGKAVLEVGAGVGLCGLLASRYSGRVVITDGNETVMKVLEKNVNENAPFPERVSACHLWWSEDISAFTALHPHRFPLVIGADVIYWAESVEPLFQTIKQVLLPGPEHVFIMSYFDRADLVHRRLKETAERMGFIREEVDIPSFAPDTHKPNAHLYKFWLPLQ
eukprot:GILI01045526.1.p1 GENE.GILI01045526.1~~GILI01045526.1.p1  ORF type:complete len:271 (+),score=69.04 GILI01045526.1:78-890(+)